MAISKPHVANFRCRDNRIPDKPITNCYLLYRDEFDELYLELRRLCVEHGGTAKECHLGSP